jgi:hypothetical protein
VGGGGSGTVLATFFCSIQVRHMCLQLETLPDENHLKPEVWAEVQEHKNKPECFGVSLGVRSFVRSYTLLLS